MPDNQVEILIKAVDEASDTLKRIEKTVNDTQKNVSKNVENTSKSFTEQTGNLLVLGNAAGRVESIFSSYSNMQLRLENASERVMNAQDRLKDSQRNLTRIQKNAQATAEDYADAQQQVNIATRNLTVSQNNLERTQNRVLGTYISIGVSVATLLASLPNLIIAVKSLTAASIAFIATPIGIILTAIGVIIGLITYEFTKYKHAVNDAATAQQKYAETTMNLEIVQSRLADVYGRTRDAIKGASNALKEFLSGPGMEESALSAEIAEKEQKRSFWQAQILNNASNLGIAGVKAAQDTVISIEQEIEKLKSLREVYTNTREAAQAQIDFQVAQQQKINEIITQSTESYKASWDERNGFVKNVFYPELHKTIIAEEEKLLAEYRKYADEQIELWQDVAVARYKAERAEKTAKIIQNVIPPKLYNTFTGNATPTPFAFAHGGIVSKPTIAMIGEAGPEAVIPLSKGKSFGDIMINYYGTGNTMEDARRLALQIKRYLAFA